MNYEIEITKYDPAGNRSLEVLTGAKLPSVFGNPAENAKPLRLYELGTNYHSQPGEECDQSLELKLRFNPGMKGLDIRLTLDLIQEEQECHYMRIRLRYEDTDCQTFKWRQDYSIDGMICDSFTDHLISAITDEKTSVYIPSDQLIEQNSDVPYMIFYDGNELTQMKLIPEPNLQDNLESAPDTSQQGEIDDERPLRTSGLFHD